MQKDDQDYRLVNDKYYLLPPQDGHIANPTCYIHLLLILPSLYFWVIFIWVEESPHEVENDDDDSERVEENILGELNFL